MTKRKGKKGPSTLPVSAVTRKELETGGMPFLLGRALMEGMTIVLVVGLAEILGIFMLKADSNLVTDTHMVTFLFIFMFLIVFFWEFLDSLLLRLKKMELLFKFVLEYLSFFLVYSLLYFTGWLEIHAEFRDGDTIASRFGTAAFLSLISTIISIVWEPFDFYMARRISIKRK